MKYKFDTEFERKLWLDIYFQSEHMGHGPLTCYMLADEALDSHRRYGRVR